jgi:hypothetical protein
MVLVMSKGISMQTARAAKEALRHEPVARNWSIGLMRRNGVLGLKVNVLAEADRKLVPSEIGSVPVHEVEVIPEVVALTARAR